MGCHPGRVTRIEQFRLDYSGRGNSRDNRPERRRRDFFGLERLTGALHNSPDNCIDRYDRRIRLGANVDLPSAALGSFESMTISRGEHRVTVHDDLTIFFFDRQEFISCAFGERFGRLVRLVGMLVIRRQRDRGDHGDARLDA